MALNIKFPIQDDKVKNFFCKTTLTTKEALKSNLLLLLNTVKGERYYNPDYGTNLMLYIFEQKDNFTEADIESDIKQSVKKWIPQLTITSVIFYRLTDDQGNTLPENQLEIEIKFNYDDNVFGKEDQIVISI